jgi:hypothetical protein
MKMLLTLLVWTGLIVAYTAACLAVGYVIGGGNVAAHADTIVVGGAFAFVARWLLERNQQSRGNERDCA